MENHPSRTECACEQLEFQGLGRRAVVARLDGAAISTDGGALLLREVEALPRSVAQLRAAWPQVLLIIRGNSGFRRENSMA